ncbi:MAG TPA: efflux RND transporter periplasmic adaptor subunit [bacterium]|nr:efflux RND transporter periplasmic adaptor subunit [bacterium]HPS31009.1 efflux RND transporter periplasmic adaptor subunit [bacterium]
MRINSIILISLTILAFSSCKKEESAVLTLSGTVESKDVRISALVGGKLTELNYDEGDELKKDSVIAKIDCRDYELQIIQADTVIKGAKARLRLIRNGARKEDIGSASEVIKQAEIGLEKAQKEYDRLEKLFQVGSITEKEFDDMKVQRDRSQSQLEQSRHVLEKLRNGAQKEEIDSVIASVEQAESSKAILQKKVNDCVITAPSDGTVLHRLAEPGEIVSPGATILTVSDISKVKIRAFVPEKELGFVKNGAEVQVFIDTFPGISFPGRVAAISSEAEFTPKTIQTADERVKTVYEFKVIVENKDRIFKPGMPADIVINKTRE